MTVRTLRRDSFMLTDDVAQMNLNSIHEFLSTSYWAQGIPKEIVARSMENSLCFGLFHTPSSPAEARHQIGFARVITDEATFAYLCDVYVLEEFRNQGLGQWLMEFVLSHPSLSFLRRFILVTRDAHALYRRFGFSAPVNPAGYMEIVHPGLYLTADADNAK